MQSNIGIDMKNFSLSCFLIQTNNNLPKKDTSLHQSLSLLQNSWYLGNILVIMRCSQNAMFINDTIVAFT